MVQACQTGYWDISVQNLILSLFSDELFEVFDDLVAARHDALDFGLRQKAPRFGGELVRVPLAQGLEQLPVALEEIFLVSQYVMQAECAGEVDHPHMPFR